MAEPTRQEEIFILLKRVFPASYHGRGMETNILFKQCRELGSSYCLRFDENGYDEKFNGFESDEVTREVSKYISDEQLLSLFTEHKGELREHVDFKGHQLTYIGKTRELKLGNDWVGLKQELCKFLSEFNQNGRAILEAIYELNFERNMRFKNYYEVIGLSFKKGYKTGMKRQGYQSIFSSLIRSGVIDKDRRHLEIFEELKPLVEDALKTC